MKIFEDFNVYDYEYSYDEMKVMQILSTMEEIADFDYEDLMHLAHAVYRIWQIKSIDNEYFDQYPWLEFKDVEEYGYIHKYAERILPELIKLYQKEPTIMTDTKFRTLLKEVFNTHMFMSKRDHHTVNELLYCLRNDVRFKDMNFNITIVTVDGDWHAIPTIDSFVHLNLLGIWFDDDKVEYEHEEVWVDCEDKASWDCITIYESKQND